MYMSTKENIKVNENIAINEPKIQLNLTKITIISMKEQITS